MIMARCRCDGGYDTHSAALAGNAFRHELNLLPSFFISMESHDGYSRLWLSSTSLMVLVVCAAVSYLNHILIIKPQDSLLGTYTNYPCVLSFLPKLWYSYLTIK